MRLLSFSSGFVDGFERIEGDYDKGFISYNIFDKFYMNGVQTLWKKSNCSSASIRLLRHENDAIVNPYNIC